jgi:hypothetical protein
MNPGATTRPDTLIVCFPFNGADEISAIRLCRIPTFLTASNLVSGSMTLPPVSTMSYSTADCPTESWQNRAAMISVNTDLINVVIRII